MGSSPARVSGLERGAVLELLDEAMQSRVVSDVPGAIGRMRFAHALIRDAGYQRSGLSSLGAAMAESLERVFGHRVRFSMSSMTSNTTRSYRSFSDAVDEIVNARVYSGIHFRKADIDGAVLGEDVARDGLEHNFERD